MTDVKRINKQATATMLFVIADAITQPRFVKLLEDNTSRFGSDGTGTVEDLHDKLRQLFDFQLKQAVSVFSEQYSVLGWEEKLQMISEKLIDLGNRTARKWRVKLHQSSKKFIVPRGVSLSKALTDLMLSAQPHRIILSQSRDPRHPDHDWRWGGDIGHADIFLASLYSFVIAKDTLSYDTGMVFFEDVLTEFGNKIEWFVKGYPHDLLVVDRMINTGPQRKDYQGIGLKTDICSTWSITSETRNILSSHGYRELRHKTYGRTKQVAA